ASADAGADDADEDAADAADGSAAESPAARLAAEHGGEWHGPLEIRRTDPGVPPEIVAAASELPAPAAGAHVQQYCETADGGRALLVLGRVEPGNPDEVTLDRRQALQQQLLRARMKAELGGYVTAVREQAKVTIPPEVLDTRF